MGGSVDAVNAQLGLRRRIDMSTVEIVGMVGLGLIAVVLAIIYFRLLTEAIRGPMTPISRAGATIISVGGCG